MGLLLSNCQQSIFFIKGRVCNLHKKYLRLNNIWLAKELVTFSPFVKSSLHHELNNKSFGTVP